MPAVTPAAAPAAAPVSSTLHLFRSSWFLDQDWLISFIVSAQRSTPRGPITWVKFVPKGHTHLLCCALKIAPLLSSLTLAKLKEEMFSFILEILNRSGPKLDFFAAPPKPKRKKVRTRTRPVGGAVAEDAMAVSLPLPSLPNPPPPVAGNTPLGDVSTPAPSAGAANTGTRARLALGLLRWHQAMTSVLPQ